MEDCDRRTWAVIFRKDSLAGKEHDYETIDIAI